MVMRKLFPTIKPGCENWDAVLTEDARKIWQDIEGLWNTRQKNYNTSYGWKLRPRTPIGEIGIPALCSLITFGEENVLLLPSFESVGEDETDIEGVGRTSVILAALGISLPYAQIMGLEKSEIILRIDKLFEYFEPRNKRAKLIASDMAFLCFNNGSPQLVPIEAEQACFAWDLARHLFRFSQLDYKKGDHRKEKWRPMLVEIFERIPFPTIQKVYGDLNHSYEIHRVMILKRVKDIFKAPECRELRGRNKWYQLKTAMLVPLKHGSPFWAFLDSRKLQRCVNSFCKRLKRSSARVAVYEITYYWPSLTIPLFIYHDIANLLEKPTYKTQKDGDEIILRGISQHNALLFNKLPTASKVSLVARSHEKLLRDPCFWKSLASTPKKINLEFFLIHPDIASFVELRAYKDKPQGFLRKEVEANIEAIQRLAKKLRNVEITLALMATDPPFRLTLIDEEYLIFTGYVPTERTGEDTNFINVNTRLCEPIVTTFKIYIDELRERYKPEKV